MNIIVPFTKLHPVTEQTVREEAELMGCSAVFFEMANEESYWWLLWSQWELGETFCLVEHDIAVWPGGLRELCECPGHWCSLTYKINGGLGIHHAFGATKISAEFIQITAGVWDRMPSKHWSKLDSQLCYEALKLGQIPHPHRPGCIHLKQAA